LLYSACTRLPAPQAESTTAVTDRPRRVRPSRQPGPPAIASADAARCLGIPVLPADARSLIATLIAPGDRDGLEAAASLDRALGDGGGLVGLTPERRDALLGCLVDPPPGLTEPRGATPPRPRAQVPQGLSGRTRPRAPFMPQTRQERLAETCGVPALEGPQPVCPCGFCGFVGIVASRRESLGADY
jgi:hypothetical protein